jgi:hypothetical protein
MPPVAGIKCHMGGTGGGGGKGGGTCGTTIFTCLLAGYIIDLFFESSDDSSGSFAVLR